MPRKPGEMFPHVEDIQAQIKAVQANIEQDNNPNTDPNSLKKVEKRLAKLELQRKRRLADTKRKEEALINALERIQVLEKENDLRRQTGEKLSKQIESLQDQINNLDVDIDEEDEEKVESLFPNSTVLSEEVEGTYSDYTHR